MPAFTAQDIHGVICPMVTPFDSQGQLDLAATRRLVDFLLEQGIHALFPGGTTGEGMLLSLAERKALCEAVVDQVAGRVPVMVHTGCINTPDTVELTLHAREAGATAATVIVPYFFTLDDTALFLHFTAVAAAVADFPIFVYTFPGNAKNDLSPALLRRLLDAAPNIAGIKSSNPDLVRFQEYVEVGGPDFLPLCGVDGLMLPALAVGARGQVSGNANVFPEPFRLLYDAFQAGDIAQARAQQRLIHRVRYALGDGVLAYFKEALALRGVPVGSVRLPQRELTPQERAGLEQALRTLGLGDSG
jgi:4-hydroxy-tetrahydrodipicolinate synthase